VRSTIGVTRPEVRSGRIVATMTLRNVPAIETTAESFGGYMRPNLSRT